MYECPRQLEKKVLVSLTYSLLKGNNAIYKNSINVICDKSSRIALLVVVKLSLK